jgi:hypothetical protein
MSKPVQTFFFSLIQVILLIVIMIGLVFVAIPPDPLHYFVGSLLQVNLLEKTPSPRVILIGGSNVALGLDAEAMQTALGLPVINDGLHAGLGIAPMRELKQYIRPGDVIIVSLEYSMFSSVDIMNGDPIFLADWIEFSPRRVSYLAHPWTDTPGIYATMLQRKVNRKVNTALFGGSLNELRTIFTGDDFDANGDFIGHTREGVVAPNKIQPTAYPASVSNEEIFVFLDEFYQFASAHGAKVYFEAPASRQSNCAATGETRMANFYKSFEKRSSIPLLTPFNQVCLPDKYFFDTPYHLNAQGREIKTKRLIENLLKLDPGLAR